MKPLCLTCIMIVGLAAGDENSTKKAPDSSLVKSHRAPLKVLGQDELDALLSKRTRSGLDSEFGAFASKFMVFSTVDTGTAVGLKAEDKTIATTELQPVFPAFYKPRLSELFDMIALQTKSTWSYQKEDQFVSSDVPDDGKPSDKVAIVTFKPHPTPLTARHPFKITPAKDWQRRDMGHWDMLIPPSAPVGMDIYEMGRYSAKDDTALAGLMKRVMKEVALACARKVSKEPKESDLKTTKVGQYDALHFDAMIPSRFGKDVHWRQWVVAVGNRCFFIVSTLFPDQDETLFKDVQAMLASFTCEGN